MDITVIVPVLGDAPAIGQVVRAAYRSTHVSSVVVVAHDAGRTQAKGHRVAADSAVRQSVRNAAMAGATVVRSHEPGRGNLLNAGIKRAAGSDLLFLDGDLRGLLTHHVNLLCLPLAEGRAAMASGLLDSGTVINQCFANLLPVLTRQRAVRRELLDMVAEESIANGNLESDLEKCAQQAVLPTHTVVLEGVWRSPRFGAESRFGPFAGALARAFRYVAHPIGMRLPRMPAAGGKSGDKREEAA